MGVGVDLALIPRLTRMLGRRPELLGQVFTSRERAIFDERTDRLEHYVAAFALKEAAFKALGQGWLESELFWMDVELLSLLSESSAQVALSGQANVRMQALGATKVYAQVDHWNALMCAQLWLLA